MSNTVSITDGSTTVQLNDGLTAWTTELPMRAADMTRQVMAATGDGVALAPSAYRDVTETIRLLVLGATADAARQNVQVIERVLDRARQVGNGWGRTRCFLQVQLAGEATVWRCEILAARLSYENPAELWRRQARVEVIITRRHYWEGPETALAMTSAVNTAPTTDPVTWHNGADNVTGERNWVSIAAAQVVGTLPSPLRLRLQLAAVNSFTLGSFWIGNYTWFAPATVDPIFTGSQSDEGTGAVAWSGSSEYIAKNWTLSEAQMQAANGQYVRPLLAFSDKPSTTTALRAALRLGAGAPGGVDIFNTDPFFAQADPWGASSVQDFGPIALPPGGFVAPAGATRLRIYATKSGGDVFTVHSAHLFPAGDGVFRRIRAAGGATWVFSNGNGIIDDGIESRIHSFDVLGTNPFLAGHFTPVHVWPNRTNLLRMINGSVTWAAGEPWTAQAWYRPRRHTV